VKLEERGKGEVFVGRSCFERRGIILKLGRKQEEREKEVLHVLLRTLYLRVYAENHSNFENLSHVFA
jgi:hypothetical protein